MWIDYENKIYDIGNFFNMRTMPMIHLLGLPQYAIEEPFHLENKADNHEEFSLQLKHFDLSAYCQTLLNKLKNVLKIIIEKL